MAQRPKGLLELLARSGSAGLGMASGMALPMYQMRQREAQDARDFQANQDYRQQTLDEQKRWRDQQTGTRNMEAYYGMMGDLAKANKPQEPDYPASLEGLYNRLYMSGDPRAEEVWRKLQEKNTFQDRPVKEPAPKMPPDVLGNTREGYKDAVQAWNYDVIPDWQKDPTGKTFMTNPMRGMMPSKEDYFNQEVAPTVPSLMRTDPQAFGPRALDSLYEGFTGQRRQMQSRTPAILSPQTQTTGGQITREQALAELRRRGLIQ